MADEQKPKPKQERELAFAYDNASTGSDAPVSFGVIPGLWTPGEAVKAEAFGMSIEQMRKAIRDYNLPLSEVKVAKGRAVETIDRGLNHLPTEDSLLSDPVRPSDAVIETTDGPIPAPAPAGVHKPLLPLAAAVQARNTVLSDGGSLEDAAAAARDAGGAWGDAVADATEEAARDNARALANRPADEPTAGGLE